MSVRICTLCGVTKPYTDFYVTQTRCKQCLKEKAQREYASGASASRSYNGVFAASLKRNYGMTLAQYDAMYAAQKGLCAVCGLPETKIRKNGEPYRLCVDHSHQTGRTRELLCHSCNIAVGAVEVKRHLLGTITAYLDAH